MPKYSYKCSQCDEITIIYHKINDIKTDCDICKSESVLKRIPSRFMLFDKKKDHKTGSVVNNSIKEFREDLEQEKQELRDEFFNPDE